MLTFRCKIAEARFTLDHRGERLTVRASREQVRRHAPITVALRGPASFVEAEVERRGEPWCRVDHAGSTCWIRVCYPATGTSNRFLVNFDAPRDEWAIDCVRHAPAPAPPSALQEGGKARCTDRMSAG